jgi:hypothetical protein
MHTGSTINNSALAVGPTLSPRMFVAMVQYTSTQIISYVWLRDIIEHCLRYLCFVSPIVQQISGEYQKQSNENRLRTEMVEVGDVFCGGILKLRGPMYCPTTNRSGNYLIFVCLRVSYGTHSFLFLLNKLDMQQPYNIQRHQHHT